MNVPIVAKKSDIATPSAKGPVEELLEYAEIILRLEARLRIAKMLRRLSRVSVLCASVGLLGCYIATALTWRHINLLLINIPLLAVVGAAVIYLGFYVYLTSDSGASNRDGGENIRSSDYNVPRIELELELAQERKRLHAANLDLGLERRQLIYRESVPLEVDRYRGESKYYRRIHNILQAVIIIGALAGSTLTSLVQSVPNLRWFAVVTTFSVGVAAGFTGYYKFRERSFYLQQTSDAIEQEFSAVGLGIGRYKDKLESEALSEFTEQVELLKIEQRKRQQQLEQPSEGRDGVQ